MTFKLPINNLFEEFTKLKKLNEKTLKKLKEIELEKIE
jgi:hypothetical protein